MREEEEQITPFFSIIIPTYNRAIFLCQTIQSVMNQQFKDWECIVVDDGSTDNTREFIQQISDPRIKYFYKKNEERSVARNYGFERAKGEYICFLDSDDQYYPHHLESLLIKIKQENFPVAIFNTGMNENRDGKISPRPIYKSSEFSHPLYFIWEKFMLPTSVCVHREILEQHKFPTKFNVWEDTHLWLRVVALYPFFQISIFTTQWNIHEEGSVAKAFSKIETNHIKNYISCISHLFQNYGEIIHPFIDLSEMRKYQLKKLKMFMSIAINSDQYLTFLRLYFYGLKILGRGRMDPFVLPLIRVKIKSKLHKLIPK